MTEKSYAMQLQGQKFIFPKVQHGASAVTNTDAHTHNGKIKSSGLSVQIWVGGFSDKQQELPCHSPRPTGTDGRNLWISLVTRHTTPPAWSHKNSEAGFPLAISEY